MFVFDDENHIETGENRRHEVEIIVALQIIPATVDRVGCCQDTAARVQRGSDTRLDRRIQSSPSVEFQMHPLTLAMEMVCCSMASWIATRSSSRILSNSSMQTTPPSAKTIAPPVVLNVPPWFFRRKNDVTFDDEILRTGISNYTGSETCGTTAFTTGVHLDGANHTMMSFLQWKNILPLLVRLFPQISRVEIWPYPDHRPKERWHHHDETTHRVDWRKE